ncbi:MAG TPA: glycosyltransferase [Candidatus Didemnitutus sp.]|nr:glycosyltransferase [Candidatus Didemnitutus sp.]
MTVLIVSEPGRDGVFRFVESLIHYLVGHAVQVHFAYSDRRGCEQLTQLVSFIREHGGATLNLAVGNAPSLADVPALRALRNFAREVHPDVIHSHSSKAGVLARTLLAFGIRTPQVYQPHAYAGMKPQGSSLRWLYETVERVLGHCGITLNVSADERNYAREKLHLEATRMVQIPNSVDTILFRPPSSARKRLLRRRFGLPEKALVLGSLGRAAPQKDPVTLYRAFAAVAERNPDIVLFHLGSGELDATLDQIVQEKNLSKRIVRLRYLATPVDFYQAVDGFILTSVYEGLSLAALEAMACDLPLILSDAPGNHDLIELPLSHLWTAPVGNVEFFSKAIRHWAASYDRYSKPRVSNHRTIALRQFDSQTNLSRVLELYHRLVSPTAEVSVESSRVFWQSAP